MTVARVRLIGTFARKRLRIFGGEVLWPCRDTAACSLGPRRGRGARYSRQDSSRAPTHEQLQQERNGEPQREPVGHGRHDMRALGLHCREDQCHLSPFRLCFRRLPTVQGETAGMVDPQRREERAKSEASDADNESRADGPLLEPLRLLCGTALERERDLAAVLGSDGFGIMLRPRSLPVS